MALKTCNLCQEEKPLDSFSVHTKRSQGRHPVCKVCRSHQAKLWYTKKRSEIIQIRREWRKQTGADRRHSYGLSIEEFNAMVVAQNGRCAIALRSRREEDFTLTIVT